MDQSSITDKLMKEPHTPFIIFFYSFTCEDECKVVNAINKYNDVSLLDLCFLGHTNSKLYLVYYNFCFCYRVISESWIFFLFLNWNFTPLGPTESLVDQEMNPDEIS